MRSAMLQDRPLDLRDFDAIFEEAKRLIPKYCPEWTDHNTSDPGMTLIELFAWMTDMILYQLNRVPDEMYERFLDLIGIHRYPPVPARADVTFYLSAPLSMPLTIQAGTEVATDRTENQEAIIFTTEQALTISPPELVGLRAWRQGHGFEDYLPYITSGLIEGPVFNEDPVEGDALFMGYAGNLAGSSLQIRVECRELEGPHIDPRNPPLVWEYWSSRENDWAPLRLLDSGGTGRLRDPRAVDPLHGLNRSGEVYLFIPTDSRPRVTDQIEATWIRVRYVQKEGQGYTQSPRVTGLRSEIIGGTVSARQALEVRDEILGKSDGEPDQSFLLREQPVLRRQEPHVVDAQLDEETATWIEVPDFSTSRDEDRHVVINYLAGKVCFGPAIRARDGSARQFGAVPRKGALLRLRSYYGGGGTSGNVGAGAIVQLKSSIPKVAGVMNYEPAAGGLNEESLAESKLRALRVLRQTEAAITSDDYERLCQEVEGVGRVRCLFPEPANGDVPPGSVHLVLVPVLDDPERTLAAADFMPPAGLVREVSSLLDERKILGTRIVYTQAELTWIEIDAQIGVRKGSDVPAMEERAVRRLREYLHPSRGGPSGHGLSFGGSISDSQIAGLLQSLPGVVFVERVRVLSQADGRDVGRAVAPKHGLLVLGRCYVKAEEAEDFA